MKAYSIVGMNYTGTEEFVKTLQTGAPAVLVREPQNQYDPTAVAVWIGGRKVGYVPKKQNAVLSKFIDDTGRGFDSEALMAMDQDPATARAIEAKFVRSPNSGYPMVQV